jgi:hypothetical protein
MADQRASLCRQDDIQRTLAIGRDCGWQNPSSEKRAGAR